MYGVCGPEHVQRRTISSFVLLGFLGQATTQANAMTTQNCGKCGGCGVVPCTKHSFNFSCNHCAGKGTEPCDLCANGNTSCQRCQRGCTQCTGHACACLGCP